MIIPFSPDRFNFWIHSVLIKLLPCFILTLISFVLIRVLYKASKRKIKLKGYQYQPPTTQQGPLAAVAHGNGTATIGGGDGKAAAAVQALTSTNQTKK